MRILSQALLCLIAQQTLSNNVVTLARLHNDDIDTSAGHERTRGLRATPVHSLGNNDYASFADWAESDEFKDHGDRCSSREPTEAEKTTSNARFSKWLGKHPCDKSGSEVTNPLCTDPAERRKMTQVMSKQIQVYFHVIQTDKGTGGVSDDQLLESIDVLNTAYDPEFKFVFDIDTDVDYTNDSRWHGGFHEEGMKTKLRRGSCSDLNVYTIKPSGGLLGWATFPWECKSSKKGMDMDGVAILSESLPKGNAAPFNLGHTLVHETGHWLGLFHTFEAGCNTVAGEVADTPPEKGPAFGCPIGQDSCERGGFDPIHNFMDYSNDACMEEFTQGQFARMLALWEDYREDKTSNADTVFSCKQGMEAVEIEIDTDDYGEETSWELYDKCAKKMIASSGPLVGGKSYQIDECLPPSEYTFTIMDIYSDGMCCDFGDGNYKVKHNGKKIKEGGKFEENEVTTFGSCSAVQESDTSSDKWKRVFFNDFDAYNGNWGNFSSSGGDARQHQGKYYHSAKSSLYIRDEGELAAIISDSIEVSSHRVLRVNFWFYTWHLKDNEGYSLDYSSDGGSTWSQTKKMVNGG